MNMRGGPSHAGRSFESQSSSPPLTTDLFADSIDHLYRCAIQADPTPRNRIAYACYLAEHGHDFEALGDFGKLCQSPAVAANSSLLAEIVFHVASIENRLESSGGAKGRAVDDWRDWEGCHSIPLDDCDHHHRPFEVASEFADLMRQLVGEIDGPAANVGSILADCDQRMLHEIGTLLDMLWRDRSAVERRRTGLALLRLGLFCGRHNWCEIEVACICKAIRCFEQAFAELHTPRAGTHRDSCAIVGSLP